MNEELIRRWNSRIAKYETVYVLGDFIMGRSVDQYLQIRERLNGIIHLIEGDHDPHYHQDLAERTWLKEIKYNGTSIILSHWSMRVWRKSHFNSWNLYGHSHGGLAPVGKAWDVGVDNNNFYPLHISELEQIIKAQPNNFNYISPEKRR